MVMECVDCHIVYDDATCWTTCPHGPLWADPDAYCREHDLINCPFHEPSNLGLGKPVRGGLREIAAQEAELLMRDPAENYVEIRDGAGRRYLATMRQLDGRSVKLDLVGQILTPVEV